MSLSAMVMQDLIPVDEMLRQGGELKDWGKLIMRICL